MEKRKRGRPKKLSKTIKTDKFKTQITGDTEAKVLENTMIKKYVQEDKAYSSGTAIILDTEAFRTLNALKSAGYPLGKIDNVNYAEDTFEKIQKKHKNSYFMLLNDYLKMIGDVPENKESVTTSFFDYTCTVQGNELVRPLDDINVFFSKKLPAKKSLLAVTLSFRNSKGNYESMTELDKAVTNKAFENGYTAVKDFGIAYRGSMFFIIYLLHKNAVFNGLTKDRLAQGIYGENFSNLSPGKKAKVTKQFSFLSLNAL